MYVKKSWIFGSNSLLKFILLKRLIWKEVRASYHELRWHKKQLEIILRGGKDSLVIEHVRDFYLDIRYHWSKIAGPKCYFEDRLHVYKVTTPTKIEMMLYYEYLFQAEKILNACKEKLINVGIDV
jgi:hypothetical protein